MKTLIIALIALLALTASAQQPSQPWSTNNYYQAKEMTFEITPTISSASLTGFGSSRTYGYSFEYEYWQTLTTGTGIEIGTYDASKNIFDHMTIMENYRLVYAPNALLFNKFALVAKVGAEQYFIDNTKGLAIGLGVNYNLFVKRVRIEASIMQHYRTDSSKNGSTLRLGLQYIF